MEKYFCLGMGLILINCICAFLVGKLKIENFYYDQEEGVKELPYGLKLIGIMVSILFFIFCFIIEFLCSKGFPTFMIPIIISIPLYYYFMFICNSTKLKVLDKKEFFRSILLLISLFYLLFIPLAEDVSLTNQVSMIVSTNMPLLELVIIIYVHLFVYAIILNVIVYFDIYNYVIKKEKISSQRFRSQHSNLAIIGFIFAGYISSIILNGQFLYYPLNFNFDKFQNIILIYQIFLSSIAVLTTLNRKLKKDVISKSDQ